MSGKTTKAEKFTEINKYPQVKDRAPLPNRHLGDTKLGLKIIQSRCGLEAVIQVQG